MPLNCLFVFEPLRFLHTCPSVLLSKFASQIKLMQSPVGVSCQSQGPRVQLPGSQVPRPRVPVPESQGPRIPGPRISGLRVPGLRVLRLRVQGPKSHVSGSQVLGLRSRFRLYLRSQSPRSQGPASQDPGSQISGLMVPGPGSQVLILDYPQ